MKIFKWIQGHFSSEGRALTLYRRGMARAKMHDHQGAIDDYTETIEMPEAPANVKAMARYNRALVHVATGDFAKGVADLDAVLAMDDAPLNVKRMAKQKLAKRESRSRKAHVC
jgi:hypothetical protein